MNGQLSLVFRTNTFEYTPGYPGDAEQVSREKMNEWERILLEDPGRLIPPVKEHDPVNPRLSRVEVVVLQGSPRADGNCGFIAGWVMEAARNAGKTVHVFFPHDMELHSCIGCYQCFNSGACTFRDDMEEILYAIRNAELVAICSPVYTNTVPAGLKTVFDRSLPYHAALTLGILENRPKGLLFAVAGRKGVSNFTCTKRVVRAFMEISGIIPAGEILFDDMDNRFSVKNIEEAESDVKTLVHQSIRL
ncbi:MAG TPA: flavodoxin family protein [Methanoregulaceae archaeon]|nr:flavodoxin family protein [Methanoregulaceae archaeon]